MIMKKKVNTVVLPWPFQHMSRALQKMECLLLSVVNSFFEMPHEFLHCVM